jgi:hypothetical protein
MVLHLLFTLISLLPFADMQVSFPPTLDALMRFFFYLNLTYGLCVHRIFKHVTSPAYVLNC